VRLQNFPVREAADDSGRRIEFYSDFDVFLLDAMWAEISEYDRLIADGFASPVQLFLKVRDCTPIPCRIHVAERNSCRPEYIIDCHTDTD
jgi:hypothetical protein